jgi:hypothetical protein
MWMNREAPKELLVGLLHPPLDEFFGDDLPLEFFYFFYLNKLAPLGLGLSFVEIEALTM